MIDKATIVALLDELDASESRVVSLEAENAKLRSQVDFLLRARMDASALEAEARKPSAAKVLLTMGHTAEPGSASSYDPD